MVIAKEGSDLVLLIIHRQYREVLCVIPTPAEVKAVLLFDTSQLKLRPIQCCVGTGEGLCWLIRWTLKEVTYLSTALAKPRMRSGRLSFVNDSAVLEPVSIINVKMIGASLGIGTVYCFISSTLFSPFLKEASGVYWPLLKSTTAHFDVREANSDGAAKAVVSRVERASSLKCIFAK